MVVTKHVYKTFRGVSEKFENFQLLVGHLDRNIFQGIVHVKVIYRKVHGQIGKISRSENPTSDQKRCDTNYQYQKRDIKLNISGFNQHREILAKFISATAIYYEIFTTDLFV